MKLRIDESPDRLTAWSEIASWWFGGVALAFLIAGWGSGVASLWDAAVKQDGVAALNAGFYLFFVTLFVGFMAAMGLGRQRVRLDRERLETAFLVFGARLCRWTVPFEQIRAIDSVDEPGSEDETHTRLRIRTDDDRVLVWTVLADNLEAEELAKRLAKRFKQLRRG